MGTQYRRECGDSASWLTWEQVAEEAHTLRTVNADPEVYFTVAIVQSDLVHFLFRTPAPASNLKREAGAKAARGLSP